MLVPLISLLVLEYYSLVTLIYSLSLVECGGDLLILFWGDLGWKEGDGGSMSDLRSGGISFSS